MFFEVETLGSTNEIGPTKCFRLIIDYNQSNMNTGEKWFPGKLLTSLNNSPRSPYIGEVSIPRSYIKVEELKIENMKNF